MKINLKHRGVVVISLSAMLIALGVGNYQLSKQSALTVSEEFEAYEQAQQDKNTDKEESKETAEITVVDSKDSEQSDIEEKAIETSKEIEEQLASKGKHE